MDALEELADANRKHARARTTASRSAPRGNSPSRRRLFATTLLALALLTGLIWAFGHRSKPGTTSTMEESAVALPEPESFQGPLPHPSMTLWQACKTGNISEVRSHIYYNTRLDLKDESDFAPIHYSEKNGQFAVTELLLEHGADGNVRDPYGNTLLHYAILKRDAKRASRLLDLRLNPNLRDMEQRAPLHVASSLGDIAAGTRGISQP